MGKLPCLCCASDYVRTWSNMHKKLRATVTLHFTTEKEYVPFHRTTFFWGFSLFPPPPSFLPKTSHGSNEEQRGPWKCYFSFEVNIKTAWFGFCTFTREKWTLRVYIMGLRNVLWLVLPGFHPYFCGNYSRHLREAKQWGCRGKFLNS